MNLKLMTERNLTENRVTLVLYPNVTGLGYVIASHPKEIYDYGVRKFRPFSKHKFIAIWKQKENEKNLQILGKN